MDGNANDSGASQDILSGQNVDSRLSALETSMVSIQQGLNAILQAQNIGNQPATSGTSTSSVSGGSSIHAPSFVSVVSSQIATPGVTLPVQSGPSGVSSVSSSQPLLDFTKNLMSLCPQNFLSNQDASPGLVVSGAFCPVPGYLVNIIKKNLFVDFTMLRPCNLDKLPAVEPVGPQLTKLLKCDKTSELRPIETFLDWAEAWGVYAGVMSKHCPAKLCDLIGYFLLIAKTSRDTLSLGWLTYDRAFRKKAADDLSLSWSTVDLSLYISSVLKPESADRRQIWSARYNDYEASKVCLKFNHTQCPFNPCRFLHVCLHCKGQHSAFNCAQKPRDRNESEPRPKCVRSPSPERSSKRKSKQ